MFKTKIFFDQKSCSLSIINEQIQTNFSSLTTLELGCSRWFQFLDDFCQKVSKFGSNRHELSFLSADFQFQRQVRASQSNFSLLSTVFVVKMISVGLRVRDDILILLRPQVIFCRKIALSEKIYAIFCNRKDSWQLMISQSKVVFNYSLQMKQFQL